MLEVTATLRQRDFYKKSPAINAVAEQVVRWGERKFEG